MLLSWAMTKTIETIETIETSALNNVVGGLTIPISAIQKGLAQNPAAFIKMMQGLGIGPG